MFKKFIIYAFRWQLSTPILWLVVRNLGMRISSTIIANLIGSAIFFWVDRFIFNAKKNKITELWQVKEESPCQSCGNPGALWRLVKTENYDRSDAKAVFLCRRCSQAKLRELEGRGIKAAFCHIQ